jgi:hypothetical protein
MAMGIRPMNHSSVSLESLRVVIAMAVQQMCLLGDGPLHLELARQLGIGTTTRPDATGTPLVVVAEQASDVQAIVRAKAWLPIVAIIAWRLPESALLRLFDLDTLVFIGLPNVDTFEAMVEAGPNRAAMVEERRRTARLAAVEAALSTRGRADEILTVGGAL